MQSNKTGHTRGRRASAPVVVNTRKPSGPVSVNARKGSVFSTISGDTTPVLPQSTRATATSQTTTDQSDGALSGGDFYTPPLMMTPVSKIPKAPRRNSRSEAPVVDRLASLNPENYNPDGTLRTVHTLPGFDESYAQAMKARYIRHKEQTDREKELSIEEIFGKSDKQ